MPSEENDTLFVLVDISGLRSLALNLEEKVHGQWLIHQLLIRLSQELSPPFDIVKQEGDAMLTTLSLNTVTKFRHPLLLGKKLIHLFNIFSDEVFHLQKLNRCRCQACSHLSFLQLKLISFLGKRSVDAKGKKQIIPEKDLKPTYSFIKKMQPEKNYFLLTASAYETIPLPEEGRIAKKQEVDEEKGFVNIYTYYPLEKRLTSSFYPSSYTKWKFNVGLRWNTFLLKKGWKVLPPFRHL